LTAAIPEDKDVDGLSSVVQEKLRQGEVGVVLPATVRAVLRVMSMWLGDESEVVEKQEARKYLIVGRSDLLGKPLYFWWKNQGKNVVLMGKSELQQARRLPQKLHEYTVIVSATGIPDLIGGDMIRQGAVLIDVGEPRGDFEWESCRRRASLITPVPGGVGPMTVVSLLENAVQLISDRSLD
jgi:methylenetetrahydrofolate dehydrogenase (NADP+)/methenyltetrahydrofolate cyclohydrolase